MDVCPCCTVYYRQTACQPVTTEVDFEKEHPSQALALPFFDAADRGHHQCYRRQLGEQDGCAGDAAVVQLYRRNKQRYTDSIDDARDQQHQKMEGRELG